MIGMKIEIMLKDNIFEVIYEKIRVFLYAMGDIDFVGISFAIRGSIS
jgi:hypothetical protein